jgi:hypothetical protein
MRRGKLYIILLMVLIAGYSWVLCNLYFIHISHVLSPCLFHLITGLPCPSCGTTRSVLSLFYLHPVDAFYYNPLGFVVMLVLCITPLWIVYDMAGKRNSFYSFYCKTEAFLRHKWVAIPLILLIMVNWIWNIHKYTL